MPRPRIKYKPLKYQRRKKAPVPPSDDDEQSTQVMSPARRHRRPPSGQDIIGWIEAKCYIPEGKLIGQSFTLDAWQQIEIKRIYDNPHGTRRAILSFGRKNGKSALAAVLLLVHLCGP